MTRDAIEILIVDDHPVVRAGLRALLDGDGLVITGEASSGEEALAIAVRSKPHVVLMDFSMRGMDGPSATRALLRLVPKTRVVLLLTFETERDIVRGRAAGAVATIAKDAPRAELRQAIVASAQRRPA